MGFVFWIAATAYGSLMGSGYFSDIPQSPPQPLAVVGGLTAPAQTCPAGGVGPTQLARMSSPVQLEVHVARINRVGMSNEARAEMERILGPDKIARVDSRTYLEWFRARTADRSAKTLTAPNVVTMSGQKACIEFGMAARSDLPLAVYQYEGIRLELLPTVKTDGAVRILLQMEIKGMEPEKFRATADLKLGQTIAIRGPRTPNAAPVGPLAGAPIVGGLFREISEMETILLVTPRLVKELPIVQSPMPLPVALTGANNKRVYVVTEGGPGGNILALPIGDQQTLLDALAQCKQFTLSPPQKIWVARPSNRGKAETILEVDWRALTNGTGPDHVLLPGDRIHIVANTLRPVTGITVAGHVEECEAPRIGAAGNRVIPDGKTGRTPLSLNDIVRLAKKGISDDIIVRQMDLTNATYRLSVDDIIHLHDQGVPDALIRAMQERFEGHESIRLPRPESPRY